MSQGKDGVPVRQGDQRVVVYTDGSGKHHAYTTVYGDEAVTQSAITSCKDAHPEFAGSVRVLSGTRVPPDELNEAA